MAETAKDTVYSPHSTPKSYTNYSGLELPEVDMRAETFLKPLLRIGTSASNVHIKTTLIPLFDIHATTAIAVDATIRAASINLTQTVANAAMKLEALYVSIDSAVTTGDWVNAIVGRIAYTAPGKADGGMAAAICAEMNLPAAAQTGGVYTALDLELNCPTSHTNAANAALPISFMRMGVWGGAKGEFDDHGYLFHLDGITVGDTHLFEANDMNDPDGTHSLKININGTDYFIMLSTSAAFDA